MDVYIAIDRIDAYGTHIYDKSTNDHTFFWAHVRVRHSMLHDNNQGGVKDSTIGFTNYD